MLVEKVAEYGAKYGMGIYSETELIALMTGVDEETAAKINMDDIVACEKLPGVGKKKVMQMMAVKEFAKRLAEKPREKVTVIHGPEDVYRFVANKLRNEQKENFCVLLLNTKNHIIGFKTVSIGSLSASIVHPREAFAEAVTAHAAQMILVHNHPSGDPTPSREDLEITERMVKCGKVMSIPVLDHVIVGYDNFRSLKESGKIREWYNKSGDFVA